jgi:hypothetical protein
LGEGTGDKVADLGLLRQHGIFQGGPPLWRPGKHGHCLQFDGTDECVDCGTGKSGWDITNELSIAAYVNQSANQTNTIFARSAFVRPARLQAQPNGKIQFRVYTDTVNDCILTATFSHAVDGSEWVHAVGSWREHDGRLYINGTLEDSDATTDGSLSFINDSQFVGIGGTYEGGSYRDVWNGKIEYVLAYNRTLSAEEVKWLHREPFAIFERSISPESMHVPMAVVSLAGSASAQSAASSTLELLRNISGTVTSTFDITALLESVRGLQEIERSWLRDALFTGMTANAFKLGTTLSLGWFWARTAGCSVLYRGLSMERIDFANILTVAEQNACVISPPSYLPHSSSSTYFYVIRRFNNCGSQEHTLDAAAKVSIDVGGELEKAQPNKVFSSRAEQLTGNNVRLVWFYCPLEQKSRPVCFNVYYDSRTEQIDYETPLARINYEGQKFYSYESEALETGRYLFAVKPEDAAGIQHSSLARLAIELDGDGPDAINILRAELV